MGLVLELPPELECELSNEAAELGLSLSEYALRLLAGGRFQSAQPRSGAELIAYWQSAGVVGMRPDAVDAPAHARELRRRAEQRQRPQ
jgi:hypothetical protein